MSYYFENRNILNSVLKLIGDQSNIIISKDSVAGIVTTLRAERSGV
jgi:hypothetical protein